MYMVNTKTTAEVKAYVFTADLKMGKLRTLTALR